MMDSKINLFKSNLSDGFVGEVSGESLAGNQPLQSQVPQISVQELKELLDAQTKSLVLVDVRNPNEHEIAQLPGWVLVPFPQIQNGEGIAKIKQLLEDKRNASPDNTPHLIVICKMGVRSAKTLALLKEEGISGINVTGGLDAWSQEIDPAIPQYSLEDMSRPQLIPVKSRSKMPLLLSSCGILIAVGVVASVFAVRQDPDLLRPLIEAGVPLEYASDLPILGYALQEAKVPQINVKQLKQLIDRKSKNYVLVDVRDKNEYDVSHLPGAVLVPLTEIEKGTGTTKIKSLLKGRQLITYGTSSKRSARALILLKKAGIKGIQVKGGIKAWKQESKRSMARTH